MAKLYSQLASWWPLLSAPQDYWEEAEFARQVLIDKCIITPFSLLELGSGGGNNAFHLKKHFAMTLVDASPEMLEVSRNLNPECEHIVGDMRTLRLDRVFDAVLIHDAIMYMTTTNHLYQAMETAFHHCRQGGAALIMPDCIRETFVNGVHHHGGYDGEGRGLRYVEWTFDPDPSDTTYVVDFAYMLREGNGPVHVEHDTHVHGLFPREDWLKLLTRSGFRGDAIKDPFGREVFVGKREL